ncbi:Olfactory Receptor 2F1 [Manis pentadactyla]|nr:Olfactory Receptor 2F1 [Manis pentadactyla]
MYLATVLGNFLIVLLIGLDSRLHTPMYFFLSNLSLVDVSYATSIVPQMLVHLLAEHKAIPFVSCAAQLFFSLGLGGIEFVLLAVMAYDRYVAVCDPLRYSVIMHGGLCARLATTSWVSGSVNSLMQTTITFQLPMCTNKCIDQVSCELLAVVRLACVDTSSNEDVKTNLELSATCQALGSVPTRWDDANIPAQDGCTRLIICSLMDTDNQTWVREFILLGLSSDWDTQVCLFVLFLVMYLATVLGNFLIVLLIRLDSRLHTPMYFFLSNLSLVDVSYATSIVPQMLVHLLAEHKAIPFVSCASQLFFSLALGGIEFVLLAVMAYDRYVAVCDPLRYSVIMHGGLCARLATTSWVSGSVNSLMQTAITFQLPMCTYKRIDHVTADFSCNVSVITYKFTIKIRLDSRLHTPMYFFISNLSLVDVSYATTIIHQMLVHLLAEHKAVSFVSCATQLFLSLDLGGIEFVLLAAMAYDCYVAVCDPLRYSVIMHGGLCARLATMSLVSGSVNALVQTAITFQLPMCTNKYINHISYNQTWVREFILLGLSSDWDTQVCLFVLFLVMYLAIVLGNFLIVLLIRLDSRLHTPMYFFISNLSLVDVSYATTIIPQMLVHLLAEHKAISFVNCAAQLFFSLGLGGIEFVLLAVMAYDCYVAVCDPLRYSVIMHGGLCARLVTVSLVSGSVNGLVQTTITFQLPTCMNKYIDHISCELLAVVRLACVDTSSNEVAIMVSSFILLMTPFCLVLLSYIQIISTILKIQSTEGRRKAFHTCASHLTVVALLLWHGHFHLHPALFQPCCPSGEVDLSLLCHFDTHAEPHDL